MQTLGVLVSLTEEGQLYLAPGHWGLKAPYSSGLAPCAAEPRLVCFLGQDSSAATGAQGSHHSAQG